MVQTPTIPIIQLFAKTHDYLIVGAGLYGAVFAHEANKKGKKCLVIDRRNHIGGNVFTRDIEGIQVHEYGPHIFHTSNKRVWDFVNDLVSFNHFINTPLADYQGIRYPLPFNMHTFKALWGISTAEDAKQKLKEQCAPFSGNPDPRNLEEQALALVGPEIYQKLIKGYSEKQWGRPAIEIPAFIIRRIPIRFTFNNNYFEDTYQGIPVGGYTRLVEKLLSGIEVRTGINYFMHRNELDSMAEKVVYTGKIDEFFEYRFGNLEYRSLRFEHELLRQSDFQGNALVNYPEREVPFTRIIEHKHFEFGTQPHTIITREYPEDYGPGKEAYYPINDARNQAILLNYQNLAKELPKVHFGGRLAEYKYYDMHHVIEKALDADF